MGIKALKQPRKPGKSKRARKANSGIASDVKSAGRKPGVMNNTEAALAFNAGNAHFRASEWSAAQTQYEKSLQLEPGFEAAALQKARVLVNMADWVPARDAFLQSLNINPDNYSAWLELGHLCRQMGEANQALNAYQKAHDTDPKRFETLLATTRLLESQNRLQEAEPVCAAALKAASSVSKKCLRETLHHLGQYRFEHGHMDLAMGSLRSALNLVNEEIQAASEDESQELRDAADEIRMNIARVLLRDNQMAPAMALLTEISKSTSWPVLVQLADLAFKARLTDEAVAVSRRTVELFPDNAWAYWNLAQLLSECWLMDEAEQLLQKAESMEPISGAEELRASIASKSGDVERALKLFRKEANKHPLEYKKASSAAMMSLYSDKLSAQEVADLHRDLFAPFGKDARAKTSFTRKPLDGRRIRIGMISADFHHQHPVNIFMQPVLKHTDHNRFETFLYFTGTSPDDQTNLAKSRVDHWVEATVLNENQLARRIETDEIDLLLDLSGHTHNNRMRLFAKRSAPVQATYLGYPGSTGVPNIDWLIGDEVVLPQGCETLYSEQLYRLPGNVFCYAPEVEFPYPEYGAEHLNRPLTFGSFNNLPKLTARTLDLWGEIMGRLPDSRLVLKAPSFSDEQTIRHVEKRLVARDIDPDRVEFRGPVGLNLMMAEYADIDIALDPVPYNGGTTTLQALWMGVPVVVRTGENFVSRMGASFMTKLDLSDWVAANDAQYVDIAVAKGSDRTALLTLKQTLREKQLANFAWNAEQHTRELEKAWEKMVREVV